MINIKNHCFIPVRTVLDNELNAVQVCRKEGSSAEYYTVIAIRHKTIRKSILGILGGETVRQEGEQVLWIESQKDALYLLFPNREDRILGTFLELYAKDGVSTVMLCKKLVMECISLQLPPPLLYMLLTESNMNIDKDGEPYFNFYLDLASYNEKIQEQDCVLRLAVFSEKWLNAVSQNRTERKVLALLSRKNLREVYTTFPALYKDLEMASDDAKGKPKHKMKLFFATYKDEIYRVLKIAALGCLCIALLLFLHEKFFSDLSLLFRYKGMEEIGSIILK